jgi:hypothetical protein
VAVVKIHWEAKEHLPDVEVLECHSFSQGLFEQVHLCAALSARYGFPVIYETNSQQGGTYADAFAHLHPETKLLRHHTDHAKKFDTEMGLTVIKRLVVDRRLRIPEEKLEDEGVVQFIQELRDLVPPFSRHNHISAAVWFAFRYAYEQYRYHAIGEIRSAYGRGNLNAMPYFGGRGSVASGYQTFGYRSYNQRDTLLQREQQKEIDRFNEQLRGSRG